MRPNTINNQLKGARVYCGSQFRGTKSIMVEKARQNSLALGTKKQTMCIPGLIWLAPVSFFFFFFKFWLWDGATHFQAESSSVFLSEKPSNSHTKMCIIKAVCSLNFPFGIYIWHGAHMEVRRRLTGASYLYYVGFMTQNYVIRLGSKHIYPQSHLTGSLGVP